MRLVDVILRDTRANQPAIADVPPGSIYYVTDEGVTERAADDLSAWEDISDAGSITSAINQLTGDVTAGPGTGSQVATIAASAVTNAKMADMADQTIKGNDSGGSAAPQDLSANEVSTILDGATDPFLRTSAAGAGGITQLTGDVTAGPGSGSQAATIANDAVTTVKILNANVTPAKLSNDAKTFSIGVTVDGGGSVITTGVKGARRIPVAATIIRWSLMADVSGDVEFDIYADDPGSIYPPTTSIVAAAPPALSAADFDDDTTLSGWTTSIAAGTVIGFEVTGVPATIERVTLQLDLRLA